MRDRNEDTYPGGGEGETRMSMTLSVVLNIAEGEASSYYKG